ncbi:MAG TPA: electron transport complex subunit RsxE [Myxococcales bacterium]|nr:electron transport complex subunit RsxE [Myxococcales bacterium]
MTAVQDLNKGLVRENPLFVLVLGTCPALALTTTVVNALGMGLAVTFVLAMSNVAISLLRKVIPSEVRIPAYIVVIASFVTMVDMLMEAYFLSLYQALGVFIPLIVVNCIILGRAEAFAAKNGLWRSLLDGLGMGLGYMLALGSMALIREVLGNGTLLSGTPLEMVVFGEGFKANPVLVMVLPPGAFLTFGLLMVGANRLRRS